MACKSDGSKAVRGMRPHGHKAWGPEGGEARSALKRNFPSRGQEGCRAALYRGYGSVDRSASLIESMVEVQPLFRRSSAVLVDTLKLPRVKLLEPNNSLGCNEGTLYAFWWPTAGPGFAALR